MEKCHYCHERIRRHEDITEVVDEGPSRAYHTHCHQRDIEEHRARGNRLPEDIPGPPMKDIVFSSGYASERCAICGRTGHLACSRTAGERR